MGLGRFGRSGEGVGVTARLKVWRFCILSCLVMGSVSFCLVLGCGALEA